MTKSIIKVSYILLALYLRRKSIIPVSHVMGREKCDWKYTLKITIQNSRVPSYGDFFEKCCPSYIDKYSCHNSREKLHSISEEFAEIELLPKRNIKILCTQYVHQYPQTRLCVYSIRQ